ncbi:7382_t:CDS:10 [Acaulospora morrowiae]|uniref:7382_t:CDS:1 n=1 Tax=Acaulospora morrowiae TaxID=94023 RepID=A0A9N8VN46_9GLOM|nr:7382_t:CDS:10 [Acaulospora morrowiae]
MWTDDQLRLLIDERKNKNPQYHDIPAVVGWIFGTTSQIQSMHGLEPAIQDLNVIVGIAMSEIHKYFVRGESRWNITDFLNECELEPFEQKIYCYTKSLKNISNNVKDCRRKSAQWLSDAQVVLGRRDDLLGFLSFKASSRPDTSPVEAAEATDENYRKLECFKSRIEPYTDYKTSRKWNKERSNKQLHLHHSTFMDHGIGTINGGTVGTINGFFATRSSMREIPNLQNNDDPKRRKIDGENPPSPRTPENHIFSSNLIISPTTRSECNDEETDSDGFDADKRDPNNYTFDEFVDGNDEYVSDDDDDQERVFLNDSDAFDENGDDNPYMFQEKNISALFTSYRSRAWQMARESGLSIEDYHEILSLSHILLLQADNFSDLQIKQFSRDTLVDFHKHMRNTCIVKTKVAQGVKTIFRECIEIALDEALGLKEAEKAVEQSFTKSFDCLIDRKSLKGCAGYNTFIYLRTKNIPVKLLKDLLSEGTLTVNIISPILRSFFHDSSIHPAIWPNTASMSAKVRKLANLDPSRAKQPDMIGNVVNNNKSKYEMMFCEITGDGKNNNKKKNNIDLIRLGIFMKDALDLLIKKTGKNHTTFAWQTIVTIWTGYIMVLTASGLYIMFDIGETKLPESIQTCGQFIDGIDNLFTFTEKYEYEVQRLRDDINKKEENIDIPVEIINQLRATLGTQFKEIIKDRK